MHRQEHPDVRRDKLLERLIDIGVYDRSDRLDLNDDPAEKTLGARGHLPCGYMVGSWWVLSKFARQIPSG
jgi:hypothetical protein